MASTIETRGQGAVPQYIDTSKPMKPEYVEGSFSALARLEACGNWDAIEYLLGGEMFSWIRKFADEELIWRIRAWDQKLADAPPRAQ